jgi:hypothetical protein
VEIGVFLEPGLTPSQDFWAVLLGRVASPFFVSDPTAVEEPPQRAIAGRHAGEASSV